VGVNTNENFGFVCCYNITLKPQGHHKNLPIHPVQKPCPHGSTRISFLSTIKSSRQIAQLPFFTSDGEYFSMGYVLRMSTGRGWTLLTGRLFSGIPRSISPLPPTLALYLRMRYHRSNTAPKKRKNRVCVGNQFENTHQNQFLVLTY
jgi:hypothetical protein